MRSTRCGAASASGWLAPLTYFLGTLGCGQPRLAMRWQLSLSSISAATSCCSDLQKALEAFKSCTFFVLGSKTSSLKYYVQMCSHLCRSSLWTAKRISRVFTLPGETALQQHRSCLQSRGRGLTCTASCNLVPHSWRFCVQTSHWLKALRRVILTKKDRATRASLFSSTESCHCLQHCSS